MGLVGKRLRMPFPRLLRCPNLSVKWPLRGEMATGFSELRGEMAAGGGALDWRIGRQNGVLVSVRGAWGVGMMGMGDTSEPWSGAFWRLSGASCFVRTGEEVLGSKRSPVVVCGRNASRLCPGWGHWRGV